MKVHEWTWKTIENGGRFASGDQIAYWVVCRECGKEDKVFATEAEANARVRELKGVVRRFTSTGPVLPTQSVFRRLRGRRARSGRSS